MPTANPESGANSPVPPWLARLNYYRTMANLPGVEEDAKLSDGDLAHAKYLVMNYRVDIMNGGGTLGADLHNEEAGNEWFTPAGLAAAKASNVNMWYSSGDVRHPGRSHRKRAQLPSAEPWGTPEWSIDGWISMPFHRAPMLNPGLARAGFASYCDEGACAAVLNVQSDAAFPSSDAGSAPPWPIRFPANDSTIGLLSFDNEWPDPRTNCPGYQWPVGLAITLMLGSGVDSHLADFQIRRENSGADWANVEACGFDSSDYTNSDSEAEQSAREGLKRYGAVVLIPRSPLVPGAIYDVAITAGGRQYQWSYSTSN